MDAENQKLIRQSGIRHGRDQQITVDGFTELELERFSGMLFGASWTRVVEGRLEHIPAYEEPPKPYEDEMLPGWRLPSNESASYQYEIFDLDHERVAYSPSISIQHLCGYNYSKSGYKRNAELLESWGFACLRSRRGDDGRFWEIWFLPGLWLAKGDLRRAINAVTYLQGHKEREAEELKVALTFLSRNCRFGTLDVCNQRMCQVMD